MLKCVYTHTERSVPRAPDSQNMHRYIWFAVLRLHPAVGNLCHISSPCESEKLWLLFCCEGRGPFRSLLFHSPSILYSSLYFHPFSFKQPCPHGIVWLPILTCKSFDSLNSGEKWLASLLSNSPFILASAPDDALNHSICLSLAGTDFNIQPGFLAR